MISMCVYFNFLQILSLVFGFIFFNLGGSRKESKSVPCENVDKINGALYIMITQMTYNFVYNVINVSVRFALHYPGPL